MNFSNELVEEAKRKLCIKTDAELLSLLTRITKQNLSSAKHGKRPLSEEQALEIAEVSGINPEWVLVNLAAQNAKSMDVKSVWATLAKKMVSHGMAIIFSVAVFTSPAQSTKPVFLRATRNSV